MTVSCLTCLFNFGWIHLICIASFIFNWYSVVARSIIEKQSLLHTLLHARDSCRCLKMLRLSVGVHWFWWWSALWFHPHNKLYSLHKQICKQWIFVWELVTDLKWCKYNFNIYTFEKSLNKLLNLFFQQSTEEEKSI